jgi:hypothetical protein
MASIVYHCIVDPDGNAQMVRQSEDVVHVYNVTIDPANHRLVVYHDPVIAEYYAEFIFSEASSGLLIGAPRAAGQTISDYADELAASFNAGNYSRIVRQALPNA